MTPATFPTWLEAGTSAEVFSGALNGLALGFEALAEETHGEDSIVNLAGAVRSAVSAYESGRLPQDQLRNFLLGLHGRYSTAFARAMEAVYDNRHGARRFAEKHNILKSWPALAAVPPLPQRSESKPGTPKHLRDFPPGLYPVVWGLSERQTRAFFLFNETGLRLQGAETTQRTLDHIDRESGSEAIHSFFDNFAVLWDKEKITNLGLNDLFKILGHENGALGYLFGENGLVVDITHFLLAVTAREHSGLVLDHVFPPPTSTRHGTYEEQAITAEGRSVLVWRTTLTPWVFNRVRSIDLYKAEELVKQGKRSGLVLIVVTSQAVLPSVRKEFFKIHPDGDLIVVKGGHFLRYRMIDGEEEIFIL
ncbi:MAG: hypothetical protein A3H42_03485 [Deltaproteobacteria bacterium RIFCSPLOWO2_02_FULL_46_8]|nr:MAG: hypothetical protein A3H42_03485 [Deltaproteobacteria bacterium RIFCSPLOWO2_02_FULL_46_8]